MAGVVSCCQCGGLFSLEDTGLQAWVKGVQYYVCNRDGENLLVCTFTGGSPF